MNVSLPRAVLSLAALTSAFEQQPFVRLGLEGSGSRE
jgi:hypothetical protein